MPRDQVLLPAWALALRSLVPGTWGGQKGLGVHAVDGIHVGGRCRSAAVLGAPSVEAVLCSALELRKLTALRGGSFNVLWPLHCCLGKRAPALK